MFGKKFLVLLLAIFTALLGFCSTTPTRITAQQVETELRVKAGQFGANSDYGLLKMERLGQNGFYYVLSPEGKLIMHPNTLWIGRDFSDVRSVKEIIKGNQGVINAEEGGIRRTIVYMKLENGDYLCCTIDTDELSAAAGGQK
jgi:hypothetical protein